MQLEGVDYAWDRPSPAGLVRAGKRFVVRYGGPGSYGKQLDRAERDQLLAAGLSIVANAEGTADGLRGGRSVGEAWARDAAQHFALLGMPEDRPIYLSVDFDAGPSHWPAIDAALAGAAREIGADRVGIYGGYDTIAHCVAAGSARWFWQTYAWSGGRWHDRAHLRQYRNHVTLAGGTVDLCRSMTDDYGQWGQGPITREADDMFDADALVAALDDDRVRARLRALPWQYTGGGIPTGMTMLGVVNELLTRSRAAGDDPKEIAAAVLSALPVDQLVDAIAAKMPAADADQLLDALAARLQRPPVS